VAGGANTTVVGKSSTVTGSNSKPVQINFEVLYQSVAGRWQLFGLSVQPGAPTSAPQTASDPASNPAKNTVSSAAKKN
jgi:hypothetical protein